MGARKGAARVGACLVPLENNLFVGPFLPLVGRGGGGGLLSYRGLFLCHFLYAGEGGFFSLCAEFFWRPCFGC